MAHTAHQDDLLNSQIPTKQAIIGKKFKKAIKGYAIK